LLFIVFVTARNDDAPIISTAAITAKLIKALVCTDPRNK